MSVDCVDVVAVYTATDPFLAMRLEESLAAEGICCFLEGRSQPGQTAVSVSVRVPVSQAERAGEVIRAL
jgi:hypothetical protein